MRSALTLHVPSARIRCRNWSRAFFHSTVRWARVRNAMAWARRRCLTRNGLLRILRFRSQRARSKAGTGATPFIFRCCKAWSRISILIWKHPLSRCPKPSRKCFCSGRRRASFRSLILTSGAKRSSAKRYLKVLRPILSAAIEKRIQWRCARSWRNIRVINRVPRAAARDVRVGGGGRAWALHQVSGWPRAQTLRFFSTLGLSGAQQEIAQRVIQEIVARLSFLNNVGLGYLSLERSAETLSGGEAQRIRLASQIGSGLTGVMYVLDEPSIGLHQRDNARLIKTLKQLRDLGNSVIVVEHDEDMIRAADDVVDMGPGAGEHGGAVVAQGAPAQIEANPHSLTGAYLAHRRAIAAPSERKQPDARRLRITGAHGNNLKHVTLDLPVGLLSCITGVSGSGKSTLIHDTLYCACARHLYGSAVEPAPYLEIEGLEHFDKVINVDQAPIGRTPRSNPATYTGVFTPIRELFASVPAAKERGYMPGRFSFTVKGGRCEACQGDGVLKVEMHFLPDVYVSCDVCRGARYNRETLDIRYKGHTIHEALNMTVEQASAFFRPVPIVARKLKTLMDVGLGYIRLGQSATTLSGGEAQRVKLALELSRRDTGRTLYILDEPTTGLHFHDIALLLEVIRRLRDAGNTIVIIEHNLDVIKTADWIVDLGPEGGARGGRIIAQGAPEQVAQIKASVTGPYLAPLLKR